MNASTDAGFGIYVHWPFCESKCPYCDFNSHVAGRINQPQWLDAYRREIRWAAEDLGSSQLNLSVVTSIFFGGGTPSLMNPETVGGILAGIRSVFTVSPDVEITLEANPSSAEIRRFRGYAEVGVNRVSIGVQSLNDDALISLGRTHGRDAALATLAAAQEVFPRYSFDLIYARPGQTVSNWTEELTEAVSLAGDHLSVYQLTIEPGTAFARDGVPAAAEGVAAAMYRKTHEILHAAGLHAYEVSNHAVPGSESRHNLTYWRSGPYLGIGPGAHGRFLTDEGWRAVYRIHDPKRWLGMVEAKGHGTAKAFSLTTEERRDEAVMMGLRMIDGINSGGFQIATGIPLEDAFAPGKLKQLVDGGFLEFDPGSLKATPEGMLRLDSVIAALLA